RFAGCRAYQAGELGKVVGGVEAGERLPPAIPIDEVVPIGDEVAERAAVVAERHTAVQPARRLDANLLGSGIELDFVPVADAFLDRPMRRVAAPVLEESGHLTHHPSSRRCAPRAPASGRAGIP